MLVGCRLFVAAENPALTRPLRDHPDWTVIDLDPEPLPDPGADEQRPAARP